MDDFFALFTTILAANIATLWFAWGAYHASKAYTAREMSWSALAAILAPAGWVLIGVYLYW